jgi:hypothetical protein
MGRTSITNTALLVNACSPPQTHQSHPKHGEKPLNHHHHIHFGILDPDQHTWNQHSGIVRNPNKINQASWAIPGASTMNTTSLGRLILTCHLTAICLSVHAIKLWDQHQTLLNILDPPPKPMPRAVWWLIHQQHLKREQNRRHKHLQPGLTRNFHSSFHHHFSCAGHQSIFSCPPKLKPRSAEDVGQDTWNVPQHGTGMDDDRSTESWQPLISFMMIPLMNTQLNGALG